VRRIGLFAGALLLLWGWSGRGWAQDATGKVVGTVYDPQGAVIPGAHVTVTNTATTVSNGTVTDKDGYFQVLSLPIGEYRVTAENAGFKKTITTAKKLHINETLRFDITLPIGTTNETVTVEANVAGVETENPTLGQSITSRTVVDMPLNGRDVLDLALLQPGVVEADPDSTGAGNFSIAGGRTDSVTYLLDGGLNNNLLDNSVVYDPNPDTIQEFRILTSDYTAEYGRNGGGIISVVTKSGTNVYHGSAFDFLRNDALNANSFFNNAFGVPRDNLKRNQFGGTLGGPITIPHIINGKDRFFFFVGYQGQRQVDTQTQHQITTFTPQELMGNFSMANAGSPDPNVVAFLTQNPYFATPNGNAAQAIIDPTKINSVAQAYIKAGLIPTDPSGFVNSQANSTNNGNEFTAKLDFAASDKDKVSATLGSFWGTTLDPFIFANVSGFPDMNRTRTYFTNASYSHVFSPSVLNEFRFTFQRNDLNQRVPAANLPTSQQLGIGITPDLATGPTNILFDTGLALGFSENGPTRLVDNTFAYTDTLSWVKGRHTWKFGGGFSAYQDNATFAFIVDGEFDLSGVGGIGSGNSFADFLLGIPNSFFESPNAPSTIRSKSTYGFAQDEWRALKNLTLTLGIRYEYSTPKLDTQGRSFSIIPGQQSQVFTNAPVGLLFPGDPAAPRGVNFPDKNDWAPRFGFAWDPWSNGKTSVRGGFGIFYDILKGEDNLQFNGQPPFFGGAGLFFCSPNLGPPGCTSPPTPITAPVPYFTDPYGSAGIPNSFPSKPPASNIDFAAAGFLPFNSSGVVYFVDPHLRTPYTYQYDLSIQRELVKSLVLETSYVGSSSHKLTSLVDINPFELGTTTRVLNDPARYPQTNMGINNFCAGATSDCPFATAPEFSNVTFANYNSLQASLQKTLSDTPFFGTTYFTLAYTWAHNIDNTSGFQQRNFQVPFYNIGQFRASADTDIRNRIVFSGGWDLPFERAWSSGPKWLTKGWSLYPIVSWRTGFTIDIPAHLSYRFDPTQPGPSAAGDPTLVNANLVGPVTYFDPHQNQTFIITACGTSTPVTGNFYFNPTSFSTDEFECDPSFDPVNNPSQRTYGTLPRNALRGPSRTNFDFAVAKSTPIVRDKLTAEFRVEFFNILNHAEFTNPDTNITSGTFGQITDTYDPRIIQLALRLKF
jgi:outer membrane receptor protein involved in Fe transport